MRRQNFGHVVALFVLVVLWASMAQAQPNPQPTKLSEVPSTEEPKQLSLKIDPVKQTWVAILTNNLGVSKIPIIKDPNSPDVKNSRQKGLGWTELTELGHSPWGKPVQSIEEIATDPKVRRNITEKTTLSPEQQAALNHGLDNPGKWIEVRAGELPILEAFWGENWQEYKVLMNLSDDFKNTKAFLYFAQETGDWFVFYAYCRNLGQPFSGFSWVANVEKPAPETEVEAKPVVRPPSCVSLRRTDSQSGSLEVGRKAEFLATFENPSGVDFDLRFALVNKSTGERTALSGFAATASVTADKPGLYQVVVEGQYEDKPIEASACKLDISFFIQSQPPTQQTASKVEQKKGHGKLIAGVAGAGVVAAAVIVATRVKSHPEAVVFPFKPPCSSPNCSQTGPANRPGLVFKF